MSILISQYQRQVDEAKEALSAHLNARRIAGLEKKVGRQARGTRLEVERVLEANSVSDILDEVDHRGEAVAIRYADRRKIKGPEVIQLMARYAEALAKLLYETAFEKKPLTDQPKMEKTRGDYMDGL